MTSGVLTVVGGVSVSPGSGNKLYKLQQKRWVDAVEFPPLEVVRSFPAVISSDGYILVIGGQDRGQNSSTVKIYEEKCNKWSDLQELPQALSRPSATLCNDKLFVIGMDRGFSCSLHNLLSRTQYQPKCDIWKSLPNLPVTDSTAAILHAQLVLIGGISPKQGKAYPVDSIYQLLDEGWVKIGTMKHPRVHCLVVQLSSTKLLILGGQKVKVDIEECTIRSS